MMRRRQIEEQEANLSPKIDDITQNPSSPYLLRCKLTTTIIGVPPWAKVLSCQMKSFSWEGGASVRCQFGYITEHHYYQIHQRLNEIQHLIFHRISETHALQTDGRKGMSLRRWLLKRELSWNKTQCPLCKRMSWPINPHSHILFCSRKGYHLWKWSLLGNQQPFFNVLVFGMVIPEREQPTKQPGDLRASLLLTSEKVVLGNWHCPVKGRVMKNCPNILLNQRWTEVKRKPASTGGAFTRGV